MHPLGPFFVGTTVLMISILFISGTQQFHYVKTPYYIFPGLNTTIAVHLFGTNYPEVNVTAEVVHDGKVLANASKVFDNDSIGLLTLPALPKNTSLPSYNMVVTGSFQDSFIFSHECSLQTQTLNMHFIQTDKNVYNPGNAVQIRVISVDHDMRPFNGLVDLIIMDPKNNPVQKWVRLNTDRGIVSTEFFLSDNAMCGLWRIQTIIRNLVKNASFVVLENVVPKFSITLNVPSFYIEPKLLNLTGAVSARSILGKPLTGNVTVYMSPSFDNLPSKSFNKTYEMERGTINFSFTSEDVLNLSNTKVINITAEVTEELTGVIMKASSHIKIVHFEYRFVITTEPFIFEAEMYVNAKIQIVRFDEAPLVKEEREKNITVTVIQTNDDTLLAMSKNNIQDNVDLHSAKSNSYSLAVREYTIPESGIINVKFPLIDLFQITVLEVQYQNTSQKWNLKKHIGSMFIQLTIPDTMKTVGEAFKVHVSSCLVVPELYYVVMAKGRIVSTGRTTNTSFTLIPEHSWVPYALVNVYILKNNGINGIVHASSDTFYIRAAPMKKASLLWSKDKVKPSEHISLTVNEAEPQSLMGLCVVEKVNNPTNRNDITLRRVENEHSAYIQNMAWDLSDSVVIRAGDIFQKWISLSDHGEEPAMEPLILPTFNPKTWLWLDNNIPDVTTTFQVTVPQRNTTWVASAFVISERLGLQLIDEPIELEVFQPLLVSLNLPYSVNRGENFVLEAILFNYLAENQEVTVTLEENDSFEITALNYDANTVVGQRKVIVPSNDAKTVLFPVKPKQLGQISFTVKATSSAASDNVTNNIFVKAEGVKQFYSESVLFELGGAEGSQALSKTLSFIFPSDVIQGSEEVYVTAVGDLLGPSIEGLESLIQMPHGCGEQNMINFAPNIYVLQYLMATKQITENTRERIINFVTLAYQKELTFKRDDGSFSAFGNGDASGSTWLSAFVFRCFLQARPFIYINPIILNQTVEWLVQYQDMNTGIFSEPGRVIHSELQGGLSGPLTLTAYVLTSLIEDEGYRKHYEDAILKAVQYLENEFDKGISSNYTLSVVVYALSLANSTKANAALTQLNSRANNIGGLKYWASSTETSYWQPSSLAIETAAYALLSHYSQSRISEGIAIMRWLCQQRNHLGGYYSTQDTIMALQALSQFMLVAPTSETSLTITITGPSSFVPKTFPINSENPLVLQSQQIAVSQPLTINVTATGRGQAIFQLNVVYNQRVSSRRKRRTLSSEAFNLDVIVNEDKNNIYRLHVNICTSYQGLRNESGMALLDVEFLSGFTLDPAGISQQESIKLVEKRDDKVYLYYDSVTKTQLCVTIPMIRVAYVTGAKDAVIRILDYYNPTNTATRSYNSLMMKRVSPCDFCGLNCTLCKSNVLVNPQGSRASSLSFHFYLFFILSIYYIVWHSYQSVISIFIYGL